MTDVKRLDDYPKEELETLMACVGYGFENHEHRETKRVLDLWLYRIRQAIENIEDRE